jgi:hypothetical protein
VILKPIGAVTADQAPYDAVAQRDFCELEGYVELFAKPRIPHVDSQAEVPITPRRSKSGKSRMRHGFLNTINDLWKGDQGYCIFNSGFVGNEHVPLEKITAQRKWRKSPADKRRPDLRVPASLFFGCSSAKSRVSRRNSSGSLATFAAIRRNSPGTGRRSKPISVPRPLPGARIAVTDIGICDRRWSNNYGAEDRTGLID